MTAEERSKRATLGPTERGRASNTANRTTNAIVSPIVENIKKLNLVARALTDSRSVYLGFDRRSAANMIIELKPLDGRLATIVDVYCGCV